MLKNPLPSRGFVFNSSALSQISVLVVRVTSRPNNPAIPPRKPGLTVKTSISKAESCTFFHAQYHAVPTQSANSTTGGRCNPTMSSSLSAKIEKPVTPAIEIPR